jgi:hypothetical protein
MALIRPVGHEGIGNVPAFEATAAPSAASPVTWFQLALKNVGVLDQAAGESLRFVGFHSIT